MKIEEKHGELVIVDFNELEACRIASKVEKDGIGFYEKLTGSVKNSSIKKSLEFLLLEERKHLRFFEERLSELRAKNKEYSEDDDLLSSMDYGIFHPYQSIDNLEDVLRSSRRALRMGLVIEEKSINFYNACKEKILNSQTQKEVSRIIAEEHKHKQLLEDILNEKNNL